MYTTSVNAQASQCRRVEMDITELTLQPVIFHLNINLRYTKPLSLYCYMYNRSYALGSCFIIPTRHFFGHTLSLRWFFNFMSDEFEISAKRRREGPDFNIFIEHFSISTRLNQPLGAINPLAPPSRIRDGPYKLLSSSYIFCSSICILEYSCISFRLCRVLQHRKECIRYSAVLNWWSE